MNEESDTVVLQKRSLPTKGAGTLEVFLHFVSVILEGKNQCNKCVYMNVLNQVNKTNCEHSWEH